MSNDSNSIFEFSPRPEAHAMDWEELLSPVQRAVRDLLLRIEGATQKELKEGAVTANCFLVYGDRGTGKTTVLLSAKRACNSTDEFFGKGKKEHLRDDAKHRAEGLKDVVWLDVLDLEPLPPGANLLTTMLTRVRNSIYPSDFERQSFEPKSILEESTDNGRQKLDQLIRDATLMWEDIQEQDTRSRANRQVAAADIYAQFQKQFKDAIDTVSKELVGRRSSSGEKYRPIVLPIDNIDRSTEHLYSIVKLAQMVFCPRLWLVMAGDREDVDTFLERAYWKELIRVGEGAGATGKAGVSGEDEALVMARRQAAAALHRLLPPSHRIEVQLVEPEETLAFEPPPTFGSKLPGYDQNIRELLEQVLVTEKETGHQDETSQPKITLDELFDMRKRLEKVAGKTAKPCLTEAAELGLRLPARQVLDLWQLAYWITNDKTIHENLKAEEIAWNMLMNGITESSISSEMGRCLQNKVIRRNPQRGTMLDFWDPGLPGKSLLNVARLILVDFQLQPWAEPYRLIVCHCKPMMLTLRPPQKGHSNGNNGDDNGNAGEPLPDLVAAWLTVLYDVVVWGSENTTVASRPDISPYTQITCSHSGAENVPWYWSGPVWENFLAHDLYGQLWQQHFLSRLRKNHDKLLKQTAGCQDSLLRLLATGYVACALETYSAFAPSGKVKVARNVLASLNGSIYEAIQKSDHMMAETIKDAEKKVMETAADVYEEIIKKRRSIYRYDEVMRPMRDWLENVLPLLLSQLLVPVTEGAATRVEEITQYLETTRLAKYWKENWYAIFAGIKMQLLEIVSRDQKELNEIHSVEQENPKIVAELVKKRLPRSIERFHDLSQLWPDSKETGA